MTTALARSLIHIVEDDAAVREALGFLIESCGGSTQAYGSAEEFLTARATRLSQSPACLLLDLNLGGQTGAEMLEQLQRDHYPAPVIVLTAYADSDLAERARRAGARRVIEKPFHHGELIQAITEALGPA